MTMNVATPVSVADHVHPTIFTAENPLLHIGFRLPR
jgi:hypothetical protein